LASRLLTARPADFRRLAEVSRSASLRGVWFALSVYALSRLFTVMVVMIAGRHQIAIPASVPAYHSSVPTGSAPGYWTIMTNWDGQWYRDIATHGYPAGLPRDVTGSVVQNAWGFYPLYPLLVGGLMWVTGLGFTVVGPAVSLVLGAAAVVVLFRLVQDALGVTAARTATVLTCTFMSAPALQTAYTESLALLLLCSTLLLLRRRRYVWTALTIVLLALTRNVVLAMAPVILLHGAVRWRARADDEFTTRDRLTLGGLVALCVASTAVWPGIAAVVTGHLSTYTQTMSAWGGELGVLGAWPRMFWAIAGPAGLFLFVVLLLLLIVLLARPDPRRWGPELWGWAVAYPAYLLLAAAAGASTPRHLLLAFPLSLFVVDLLRRLPSPVARAWVIVVTVGGGLALQWVWVSTFLVVTDPAHQLLP
jgi:hypothetical protein